MIRSYSLSQARTSNIAINKEIKIFLIILNRMSIFVIFKT